MKDPGKISVSSKKDIFIDASESKPIRKDTNPVIV